MNATELQKIVDWLIDGARSTSSPTQMMAEICERLVEAGLPLWRVGVFVRTLHPDVFGRNFIWRPGAEVTTATAGFDVIDSPEYINNPLAIVFGERREVRCRLDDPESKRFPFLDEMREEGVTDYIALPLLFIDGSTHASSWTTKRPGGFSDGELATLRKIVTPLARIIEIVNLRRTASILLDTYVGNRAGERILGGQIRRGHTDTMDAAIWLSDLRGFTALSDRLPAETVVDILNRYFDCQVSAIRNHGGEVLKFMGDGLLAVFPIAEQEDEVHQVCARVLEAARESRASVEAMHYPIGEALERFRFGVLTHPAEHSDLKTVLSAIGGPMLFLIGTILFKHTFRGFLQLSGRLNRTIVASAGFAGVCGVGWADLGEFPIAGFANAERVYGLADESPA